QDRSRVGAEAIDKSRGCDWTGKVWHDSDEVCLAESGDLHHLGNASNVGEGSTDEVDVVIFHERVEVPPISPFFTGGQGNVDLFPQDGQVLEKSLGANGVLEKERGETLDFVAAANCIGEIESLMKVDDPIAVFAYAFPCCRAFLCEVVDALSCV